MQRPSRNIAKGWGRIDRTRGREREETQQNTVTETDTRHRIDTLFILLFRCFTFIISFHFIFPFRRPICLSVPSLIRLIRFFCFTFFASLYTRLSDISVCVHSIYIILRWIYDNTRALFILLYLFYCIAVASIGYRMTRVRDMRERSHNSRYAF